MSLKKLSSKNLPYWKDWKKTEQNFYLNQRLSLVDRPQKAFDPCLDTGEVGEGPVVEPFVETLEAEKIRGT